MLSELRLILLFGYAIAVGGCVSSEAMQFSVVSVSELPSDTHIIQEDVVGQHCPESGESYGSYSEAARKAIASAPPANVLTNVRISSAEKPVAKICVTVSGDAAKL